MKPIILVIAISLIAPIVPAQDALDQPADAQTRLASLQTQVDVMKEYQDRFLTVVLWALGTAVVLTVALAGFNWFQSNRLLQREIDSIRAELRASVESRVADEAQNLWTQVETSVRDLESVSARAIEPVAAELRDSLSRVQRQVGRLLWDVQEAEAKEWVREGVPANVLVCAVRLVEISATTGGFINFSFEWLDRGLSMMEKRNERINPSDVVRLDQALVRLGPAFGEVRAAVMKRVQELQARPAPGDE